MTVKHTYHHSDNSLLFFRLVHISLALPLCLHVCVRASWSTVFYSSTYYFDSLENSLHFIQIGWIFDFFYLLFFFWFHFICSMLCYHRLLVFFSFRLCSLFSFFVPYWLYALQVNEIKNLQWKVKRKEKKKVSRKWTTNILNWGIHPNSVWCLMIIQNMCTCCWLQEISSKHYTIKGHTKSTNASNQNQNQPI